MPRWKKDILSIDEAIYLLINEELSDIDRENSQADELECFSNMQNADTSDTSSNSIIDIDSWVESTAAISIGNKLLDVEIENLNEKLDEKSEELEDKFAEISANDNDTIKFMQHFKTE